MNKENDFYNFKTMPMDKVKLVGLVVAGKGILDGSSRWDIGLCPAGIKSILRYEIEQAEEHGKRNYKELKRIMGRVKYYINNHDKIH